MDRNTGSQPDNTGSTPVSPPNCQKPQGNKCREGDMCCYGAEAKGEQPGCLPSEVGSSPTGPAIVGIAADNRQIYVVWSDGQVWRGWPASSGDYEWRRCKNVPRE